MVIIVTNPKTFSDGTISGIKLFVFNVLPGLFPFMLITKIITELGFVFSVCGKFDKISYKLFGTRGISLYALFMSVVSGYPIGARIIADLYEKNLITEKEAKKMCVFCTTSGPIFVIGTVGSIMFNNFTFGIILYVSHISSSVLLGIIFNLFDKNKQSFSKNETKMQFLKSKNIIGKSINQTIDSLFVVCAYITIFYLIAELFSTLKVFDCLVVAFSPIFKIFNLDQSFVKGFVYGIIEVTRGSKVLSAISTKSALILTSGILSFSGLSIIFQSMAFLKQAKIKTHFFVFVKSVHMILSMLICFLLTLLI